MRILFIHKYNFIEPLGIMTLSAFLKKNNHQCYFLDVKFEKDINSKIKKISPDIIAYSITTGEHQFYQKLNLNLKKQFKFISVFGGPHCTFFPEFIHENGVDIICRGEGEFPFLELANNLEKGKDITKIKNLYIKKSGKIYKNELRNLIENLDDMPFPDRELLNDYKHYRKTKRRYIITGRGCPYNCAYCFNHSYNKLYKNRGKIIRRRSVQNVINELRIIKRKYSPKRFHFVDDTFILNREWVIKFFREYKKEISLPFIINVRVNLVDEELVKEIKNAGCITAVYAIESGDDNLRNNILKRNVSKKEIIDTGRLFNKYKIETYVQNMIGLPDETLDMIFETVKLNIKCRPSYAWVSIFQPYPKTDLCEYSKQRGYFEENISSFNESYYYKSVMKIKNVKEIERLHHLFSLSVAFPLLIPLVKQMIKLPLDNFYRIVWEIHRTWCYLFRVKWIYPSEILITE